MNNPFPMNYNTMTNTMGDFNTSFNTPMSLAVNGYDPKGMFQNHNFVNKNDILHNNINKSVLNEEIREYSILIDSKDRNYQVYKDPFQYEVKFSPLHKIVEIVDGVKKVYEQPNPIINGKFEKVRYIKLEHVILPFYNQIRLSKDIVDDDIIERWKINTSKPLTDNLYTVLCIDNYGDVNYKSTNDVLSESFATIYFDKKINNTHFIGKAHNGIKTFPQDQLGKIDKIKISFRDPYGNNLSCPHVNKSIMSNMECTCEDPSGDEDTECFRHNLFHPLNPIFQHHLHFKVGVVEPRLNKLIFN
ncbi:hypothetical protein QJ854_gp516 [Moumouvirus goulette]|uniref:Uncharacterized protein n=1 Tax=Moumouvirus goulette TaxID=1247379 RepID=M1PMR2_9VIRU|nr:hypothetical protein QJ854_gp516 [Moumouvirus goulette]AGF85266.1 hypothetical protein glt_00457 [Moumouvirus goulette]